MMDKSSEVVRGKVEKFIWEAPNGYFKILVIEDLHGDKLKVKGLLPRIKLGSSYEFTGTWKEDKYGMIFEAAFSVLFGEGQDSESLLEYLGSGLVRGFGPTLAQRVIDTFGSDTVSIIEKNPSKLLEVPGIGPDKIEKLKESWKNQASTREVIIGLQKKGLPINLAIKVYTAFGSSSLERLLDDPYQSLISIDGIGFKTADRIALGMGIEPTSIKRLKGAIKYLLEVQAPSFGHVYLMRGQLISDALELLGDPVTEKMMDKAISKSIKSGQVIRETYWEDSETKKTALYSKKMYKHETVVADLLSELSKRRPKKVLEPDFPALYGYSGYDYDEIQKEAVLKASNSQILVITGGPGCVDCETEFFNGTRWKKISEYEEGDKVLQYNRDGSANLVYPEAYIKEPCDHMTLIKSKYGVNQCVSDDHRLVYESEKGEFSINRMEAISKEDFNGKFYNSFSYSGQGVELGDQEIKELSRRLFKGNSDISFDPRWYEFTEHQYKVFCGEILGIELPYIISTRDKDVSDFIQFAFSSTGHGSIVSLSNGLYSIWITEDTRVESEIMSDTVPGDGYKYCFTVPSSMLVLRREGCINITGNCGKTTTTLGILKTFQDNGLNVLLAAPTGRAAQRMSEVTEGDAKTIHSLLEYNPEVGFQRDELNPLEGDALIVDEFSMVDISLMYHLMRAIPRNMRLIIVGDVDQLPSVGPGLVLRDIIDSGVIPVVKLTKIFRQAQDSKIVVNAHKINAGEMIDLEESTNFEADQDFYFVESPSVMDILRNIITFTCNSIPNRFHYLPSQIQVLSPQKTSEVGVENLNRVLQGALNPEGDSFTHGSTVFRLGDRVMHIRNNYEKGVFNGEIGKIVDLSVMKKSLIVLYDGAKSRRVEYIGYDLDELVLAYATTIHKSQGNEYPVVIIPLTMTHSFMLQRNLIYTALTRAKKLCIFVGTQIALFTAISNIKPSMRNSRLKERLQTLICNEKE